MREVERIPNLSMANEGRHLYLRHISEPRDNSLRIVVEEAVPSTLNTASPLSSGASRALRDIGGLEGARPIESTANCKTFEFYWRRYVAYLVTEECVGSCGKYGDEEYTGTLLRCYTKSHFLDHLARDAGGHMKPVQHYKLICLNHLIDVASEEPPEIRIISDPTREARPVQ